MQAEKEKIEAKIKGVEDEIEELEARLEAKRREREGMVGERQECE